MNTAEVQTLIDYNYWANGRVVAAAQHVSEEELCAPAGLSFGSLLGTLAHILGPEIVWRLRCQEGVSLAAIPGQADFPTLARLLARWQEEEALWRAYVAGLAEDDLDRPIRYTDTKGRPFATPLWHILTHVVNHGTQFRAEAGVGLTRLGHSPGDLDFILFVRTR